jgi:hypothetical protein
MSRPTTNSRLIDLKYTMDTNFENMKTEIGKVCNVNAWAEEELASLKTCIDKAKVGLPSFYPHPCTAYQPLD